MTEWRVAYGPHTSIDTVAGTVATGKPQWDIPDPQGFQITFDLTDPHELQFTTNARSQQAAQLSELVDDVWAWRDNQLMFRGPVVACDDTLDPDSHNVQVTARSYKEKFSRNISSAAATSSAAAGQSPIDAIVSMLAASHAPHDVLSYLVLDGNMSGTPMAAADGSSAAWQDYKTIIDAFATIGAGFEWDLVPYPDNTLHFQAWWPQRGRVTGEILDYGGAFTGATRQLDFSSFANYLYATYTDAAQKPQAALASVGSYWLTDPGGWAVTQDVSDLSSDSTGTVSAAVAQSRANYYLGLAQVAHPTYSLTMAPGWWTPQRLFLGDTGRLVLNSGRLNVAIDDRVSNIVVTAQDGTENVVLSIGPPPVTMQRFMRKLGKRINTLERNQ